MSDSVPPVQMPDSEPTPRRRNGGEVPPPRFRFADGFGAPRSLQGIRKLRHGDALGPHGKRGMK